VKRFGERETIESQWFFS